MLISNNWKDYEILDMSNGEKLEKWGDIYLIRPDPQIIWPNKSFPELWKKAHGHYHRSNKGGGEWEFKKKVPDSWQIKYKDLTFNLKPMGFKHTGLFPEQRSPLLYQDLLSLPTLRRVGLTVCILLVCSRHAVQQLP